ncbi:MAG: hypothetical protein ACRQFF_07775 [Sphaerochaeta sp.]
MNKRFELQLFSSDLKRYRKINSLSQAQLAQLMDIRLVSIISNIERLKDYPSYEFVNEFCKISNNDESKYWKEKKDEVPLDFLNNQTNGMRQKDIERLCRNIETQEYLLKLKKRFY